MWNEQLHAICVETVKPTLAYMSKFPTLLYYKMMGITPLINNFINWKIQFVTNLQSNYYMTKSSMSFFSYELS